MYVVLCDLRVMWFVSTRIIIFLLFWMFNFSAYDCDLFWFHLHHDSAFRSQKKARSLAATATKKVLVLGAGYVAGPLVEYLTRDQTIHVTIGKWLFFSLLYFCDNLLLCFK